MIKKSLKKKICKSCKGALAIFLCIIFTPFLSISYSLVEFSRMQSASETVGEITDMSALSTLSNYDKYLKERFGILALSQNSNFKLSNEYDKYFKENIKMLGEAIDTSKTTSNVSGKMALNSITKNKYNEDELSVLKSQILDYSESTVAFDIINKDLNLEELMEKINELLNADIFDGLLSVFDFLGTITGTIKGLVSSVESIVTGWTQISEIYNGIETKCNDIINTFRELIKSIYDKYGDKIINPEEEDSIIEDIKKNPEYMDEFKGVYNDVKDLLGEVKEIKDKITEVIGEVQEEADKIDSDIKEQSQNIIKNKNKSDNSNNSNNSSNSNNSNTNTSLSDALSNNSTFIISVANFSNSLFEDLTKKITEKLGERLGKNADKIVDECTKNIEDTFGKYDPNNPDTLKSSVDTLMRNGVIPIIQRVTENGSDIDDDVWNAKIKEVLFDGILSSLKRITDISLGDMVSIVTDAITEIISGFLDTLQALIDWLLKTVDIFKHMFELNSFYDPELDAILSNDVLGKLSNNSSEYQELFTSLQKFLSAANTISEVIRGKKSVISALDALGDLSEGVKGIFGAIKTRFKNMSENLSHIVKSVGSGVGGAANDFYEKLLIAGYATHNFPNRNMKASSDYKNLVQSIKLNGKATTGYEYKNISNKKTDLSNGNKIINIINGLTGIDAVVEIFKSAIQEGGGSDETFVGAELEYINAGTSSEVVNQIVSFMDVYLFRMVLDMPAYLLDGDAMQIAEELGSPTFGIGAAIYYVILILVEPALDTFFLVNGQEVSIVRIKCYLTMNGLEDLVNDCMDTLKSKAGELKGAFGELEKEVKKQNNNTNNGNNSNTNGNNTGGNSQKDSTDIAKNPESKSKIENWLGDFMKDLLKADYSTHMLLILMVCRGQNQILANICNMIQLEAASYYKNQKGALVNAADAASNNGGYSLSKAYTTIHAETEVQHNSFLSNFQLNDKSIMKKKYIQDRGY